MNKRLFSAFLALILVFTLFSCKPTNTDGQREVDKQFFRQAAYSNGDFIFAATGKECTFYSNQYDEIMSAFRLLEAEYKLDELTYAFDYHGDDYTVTYTFIMNPKSADFNFQSISCLSDCIAASSFINYRVSIAINGTDCDAKHTENTESHPPTIQLIFDDAQPEAPKIFEPSLLGYEVSDYINLIEYEPHYLYSVTYDGRPLFYVSSCVEFDEEIFSFFKDYLVQFDGRM